MGRLWFAPNSLEAPIFHVHDARSSSGLAWGLTFEARHLPLWRRE